MLYPFLLYTKSWVNLREFESKPYTWDLISMTITYVFFWKAPMFGHQEFMNLIHVYMQNILAYMFGLKTYLPNMFLNLT